MFVIGHSRKPRTIEPHIWPARRGGARVLVENRDRVEAWARTEALRGPQHGSVRRPGDYGH